MSFHGMGPASVTTEVEALEVDLLGSSITSENNTAATAVKFHPLANRFPLMLGDEFKEFVRDIEANGLREPIWLYQGKILDGRNRYLACLQLKLKPVFEEFDGDDAAAAAFVISRNIFRRHLKPKEKREALKELLKAAPQASNNAIAKQAKVDDKTVAKVRREMEARSEIPNVSVRTDTKGRKQPATKVKTKPTELAAAATAPQEAVPKKPKRAAKEKAEKRELEAAQAHIDELEAAREHDTDLAEKLRMAEIRIVGLEGQIADLKDANAALKAENAGLREKLEAARKVAS